MKYSFFTFLFTFLALIENALATGGGPGNPTIPEPGTLALFAGAGISLFILKKLKK